MSGTTWKVKIPVSIFKEGKMFVAYSHALDLSSCGKTQKEAHSRFAGAVKLFLDKLEEMGTLDEVLIELGWRKKSHPQKCWIPPHLLAQKQVQVGIPAYH